MSLTCRFLLRIPQDVDNFFGTNIYTMSFPLQIIACIHSNASNWKKDKIKWQWLWMRIGFRISFYPDSLLFSLILKAEIRTLCVKGPSIFNQNGFKWALVSDFDEKNNISNILWASKLQIMDSCFREILISHDFTHLTDPMYSCILFISDVRASLDERWFTFIASVKPGARLTIWMQCHFLWWTFE